MLSPSIRISLCFLIHFIANGLLFVDASESSYTPQPSNAFQEMWRWRVLEALEPYFILGGFEDEEDNLWFASTEGMLFYDGYDVEQVPFSKEFQGIETHSIHYLGERRFYAVTSAGLLYYNQGEWSRLLSFSVEFPANRYLFAENSEGLLVVGTPYGLYSLHGDKAELVANLGSDICSVAQSGTGDLFVATSQSNKVTRIPFSLSGLANSDSWKTLAAAPEGVAGLFLFSSGPDSSVVALNFFKNSEATYYSYETNGWKTFEVGEDQLGYYHQSGLSVDEDTILIFSKTSIHIRQGGTWSSIESSEHDIPLNASYSFVRRNGNVVIGGRGESVREIALSESRWRSYDGLHFQCDSPNGSAWFLSVEGWVIEHDFTSDTWVRHSGNIISTPTSIIRSDDGYIWISGSHEGVGAVSYYDGEKWTMDIHPEMVSSISHLSTRQLRNGCVVFGSGHEFEVNVGGMMIYSKANGKYKFKHVTSPEVPYRLVGIAEAEPGKLWFGGYNVSFNTFPFIQNYRVDPESAGLKWVDHLSEADDGSLYVALWQEGLFRIDEGSWTQITSPENVASDQVFYILRDRFRKNNLWVANSRGVSRFDGRDWFPDAIHTGMRLNREGAVLRQSSDAAVWINLTSRDWYFRTSLVAEPAELDSLLFRTIRYFPELDVPKVWIDYFDESATEPANVVVKWKGADRWSKTPKERLMYSYRLDGQEWSAFENQNEVILMGTKGGNHELEVRVRDLEGNMSPDIAVASFYVNPPIWKRPWFIASSLFVIALILLLTYLLVRQRVRHLLQLEEFKLQFFTNLSHEIRTPLTVIMGPLESALGRLPEGFDRKPIEVAYRNSKKMLHLVDQILEFRKIEIGRVENHYVEGDIIKDLKETIQLLMPLTEEKKLSISTGFSDEHFSARYDAEKTERILTNLVSNAIKYSNEKGSISINCRIGSSHDRGTSILYLTIEDDGIGIPKEKLGHIFEPFYRVKGSGSGKIRGVGLGLSLVKSLVDALHGEVVVESPAVVVDGQPKGTRFKVSFPIEVVADRGDDQVNASDSDPSEPIEHDGELILIAEDEREIREFIADEFKEDYQVIACDNGKEALREAKIHIPDLIITDVVMPEMDGNELTERIKHTPLTSHIPVIVLTALKSEEHELRSLNRGADDFLNKPISISVLKQKVRNAIQSRKAIREQFRDQVQTQMGETSETVTKGSADDEFLSDCHALIEGAIQDPLFDIEILAKILGMSRMTLYRKFKAITGMTPSEYVRDLKMKKAAALLQQGELTVSEISDAVGFQELSNFSIAFKKHFGTPPSQFAKSKRK